MPLRSVRLRRGRLRLVRRRLWRWLRDGVVLRRWRNDDERRGKILAGGGKRGGKGDQRCPGGKSNGARLHGRVPRRRSALGSPRPVDAPARAGKAIWSRPNQFAYSRRPLRVGSPPCAPKPRLDDFCIARRTAERSPIISCAKRGIPEWAAKNKAAADRAACRRARWPSSEGRSYEPPSERGERDQRLRPTARLPA